MWQTGFVKLLWVNYVLYHMYQVSILKNTEVVQIQPQDEEDKTQIVTHSFAELCLRKLSFQ